MYNKDQLYMLKLRVLELEEIIYNGDASYMDEFELDQLLDAINDSSVEVEFIQ